MEEIFRNQITINSVTKTGDIVTGMSIGYDEDEYSGLFEFADTEEEVLKKAETIYLNEYVNNKQK